MGSPLNYDKLAPIVKEMQAAGKSNREIARAIGCAPDSIRRIMQYIGIYKRNGNNFYTKAFFYAQQRRKLERQAYNSFIADLRRYHPERETKNG